MQPSCVVTGSAGFIGSRLSHRLLDAGWRVVGIDAFTDSYAPAEKLARAQCLSRRSGYRQVAGDLNEVRLGEALRSSEVVFHLAGRAGVRPSFRQESRYRHDNIEATERLLRACQTSSSVRRIVYASSSSVYGDAPLPFREDMAAAPISPYGHTKLAAEAICLSADSPSLGSLALRYFTVYGPGQRPDMGLRRFAEAVIDGRKIRLFGDGTQSRDFTFVDDVVDATIAAADAPRTGMAINVGGGSQVNLLEVLEMLGQLLDRPVRTEIEAFARGDVRHTGADLTRATEQLNFRPRISFSEGYAQEVEWLVWRAGREDQPCK